MLKNLFLSMLLVFAPIQAVLLTTFTLVMADLILGIMAARKRGELITSAGFQRTIIKLAVYEAAICFGFLAETYLTGPLVPISKIVAGFVGLTEITSIFESLNEVSGQNLLKGIIDKLASKNDPKNR